MSHETELVLPSDVRLIPVQDLNSHTRERLNVETNDYVVTHLRSRTPSRIVDEASATLLQLFRNPVRIVDAIIHLANQRDINPEVLLEQAHPLLSKFRHEKLLVPVDNESAKPNEHKLHLGDTIRDFALVRSIQIVGDTEVYLARSSARGRYAAVKFHCDHESRAAEALKHEAVVMRFLHPKTSRVPELLHLAIFDGGIALISEWVLGLDVESRAAGLRGRFEQPRNDAKLLMLCVEVAQAFADLHSCGVVHGDVHPRNVIVDATGHVRLLDFGISQITRQFNRDVRRGGVGFYFDPELAAAQHAHCDAPLTASGEQYSVAALVYQLWTGTHYINWKLERHEMLQQILIEGPAIFEARGIIPWPDLELVLRRALDKRAECRFESMAMFAEALRGLSNPPGVHDGRTAWPNRFGAQERNIVETFLQSFGEPRATLFEGADAPVASINYGAGGVAYAVYRMSQRRGSARLLAAADAWIQRAYSFASQEHAFHKPEWGIEPATVGEVSLFHSISGLHCVRALVSIGFGDIDGATRAIHAFVGHSHRPSKNPDLTLGKASLLIGLSELVEALPSPWFISLEPVIRRGDELVAELIEIIKTESISSSSRVPSLGIAHGWAGILFAIMRWAKATKTYPDKIVAERLYELASFAEPHGLGMRWPVHNATRPASFIDGWCNGTAGHVMLFALSHDVLGTNAFDELVERAAESAWATETRLGTLCCGLGGMGYAFAATYRLTGSQKWIQRARMFARRAAADNSKHFFSNSLYKGSVGVALLTEALNEPSDVAMPLFEPIS